MLYKKLIIFKRSYKIWIQNFKKLLWTTISPFNTGEESLFDAPSFQHKHGSNDYTRKQQQRKRGRNAERSKNTKNNCMFWESRKEEGKKTF